MLRLFQILITNLRIKQNFDIYITISIGISVGVLAAFGKLTDDKVLAATLVTLNLIAILFLGTRRMIAHLLESPVSAENFFQKSLPGNLDVILLGAKESICITGMSLKRTVVTYSSVFQEQLKRGCNVKILLIKPEGHGIQLGGERISQVINKTRHQEYVKDTVKTLEWIANQTNGPGRLELKFLDYVPPFGLFLIDHNRYAGQIYVEIYNWRMEVGSIPVFILTPSKDRQWFSFFCEQFETLWANAESYKFGAD